jgi:hypothetical protein
MRVVSTLLLAFGLAAGLTVWPGASAQAQSQIGPDGTPQIEPGTERLPYAEAATPQLLTHYWIAFYELDQLPDDPTPDQVKASELRKRLLDLRLMMDLYAFSYDPALFATYRRAIDDAYEAIGQYKDLFDIQEIDGAPIDAGLRQARLARMNVALAPFRLPRFRDDLKAFFYQAAAQPASLTVEQQPRLWQIAGRQPDPRLDSLSNAGLLGQAVLRNLLGEGILVGDILDPAQEERFHDVRKAMRSVLVLADMYPSLTAELGEAREPLAALVKAYGKTNDQINAYRAALEAGRDTAPRVEALRTSHEKAQLLARELLENGQLDSYVAKLGGPLASTGR